MKLKCDMCERVICTERPNRPQNELQGATFVLSDGDTITVCKECLEKTSEDSNYMYEFLEMRDRKI